MALLWQNSALSFNLKSVTTYMLQLYQLAPNWIIVNEFNCMHVGTAMKLSCCSLAETMKMQCIFFCFARDTKEETLVIYFNKDKFLLIWREIRFHSKQFSKAALGGCRGSAGSLWPHSQVCSDNLLVCSHLKTVITQFMISPLLASGASGTGGSPYPIVLMMAVIVCSNS